MLNDAVDNKEGGFTLIELMIVVAIIGLCVNAFTGFLMFKGGNLENINIKSAFLHLMSDLLSSVAVIIGGIVVYFTQIYYIDTILYKVVPKPSSPV